MAPGDGSVLSYDSIYMDNDTISGQLRVVPSGVAFRLTTTKETTTIPASDIRRVGWSKAARKNELRIVTKGDGGRVINFSNIEDDALESIKGGVQQFGVGLEVVEYAVRGWNWGKARVNQQELTFEVNSRPAFDIPLNSVGNTNLAGKTEVVVELKLDQKAITTDELVEVRFFVPGTVADQEDGDEGGGGGGGNDDDEDLTAATLLYNSIKDRSQAGETIGDSIVTFAETNFTTPRGRYDVELFDESFRLRGKTYDYKVPYGSITRMFLLPKPDDAHMNFALKLDPPMRQGQTRYPFLIMQFPREEEMEVELNMDEEIHTMKYKDKLKLQYDQAAYEVVSSVFRGLSNRKVTIPGSFVGYSGQPCIKCSMKASEGHIYMLDKLCLFIPKPPTLIAYSEVTSVALSRGGSGVGASRTFDASFFLTDDSEHQFLNFAREEQDALVSFLKQKQIKVVTEASDDALLAAALDEDEDDDEDDEDDEDVRGSANEDSESPDEDFDGDESDSDVGEEFDENFKGDDSEEGDADGGDAPARKKPKA